jgi:hypothetical protein
MEDARLELGRWELAAAVDELKSFAANVDAGVPRKALGNLYYTAFHLAQALLVSRGVSAHTHNGVRESRSRCTSSSPGPSRKPRQRSCPSCRRCVSAQTTKSIWLTTRRMCAATSKRPRN